MPNPAVHRRGRLRISTRPQVQHIEKILAKIDKPFGIERGGEIDDSRAVQSRLLPNDRVPLADQVKEITLHVEGIGKISTGLVPQARNLILLAPVTR